MVKLYEGGAYLLHGTEVIADAPDALAAVKSKTGIETTKEAAAKETMAYGILSAHNTSGNMQQLQIKFDKLTSHDITFVGIIQTARASGLEKFPVAALCDAPFMMLEKDARADAAEIFERCGLSPSVRFTTWDDYAIMSMVESGLGVSILPELILQRVPYRICVRELDVPAYRRIGLALRDRESASLAVKCFLEYLKYRHDTLDSSKSEKT